MFQCMFAGEITGICDFSSIYFRMTGTVQCQVEPVLNGRDLKGVAFVMGWGYCLTSGETQASSVIKLN